MPFTKIEPPYDEIKDLIERIWDVWGEHGKNRERVGEFMQRVGLGNFLEAIEVDGFTVIPDVFDADRAARAVDGRVRQVKVRYRDHGRDVWIAASDGRADAGSGFQSVDKPDRFFLRRTEDAAAKRRGPQERRHRRVAGRDRPSRGHRDGPPGQQGA